MVTPREAPLRTKAVLPLSSALASSTHQRGISRRPAPLGIETPSFVRHILAEGPLAGQWGQ